MAFRYINAFAALVEVKSGCLLPVVDKQVETARKGNDELFAFVVGVSLSRLSARNIVNPISSFNFKRHRHFRLDNREIASFVAYLA